MSRWVEGRSHRQQITIAGIMLAHKQLPFDTYWVPDVRNFFGTTRRKRTISFWRRRYASYRSRGALRAATRCCSGLPRENREKFDDRSPRLKRPPFGQYRPPGVQIFFRITRRRTPTSYFRRRDASAARKTTNGGATGTNFLSSDSA